MKRQIRPNLVVSRQAKSTQDLMGTEDLVQGGEVITRESIREKGKGQSLRKVFSGIWVGATELVCKRFPQHQTQRNVRETAVCLAKKLDHTINKGAWKPSAKEGQYGRLQEIACATQRRDLNDSYLHRLFGAFIFFIAIGGDMMRNRAVGVLNILLVVAMPVQGFAPAAWAGELRMYERGTPEVGKAQAGLMDDPTSTTSELPPLAQLKIPDLADIQRTTLAQAGTPAPDQKKPADCAALEQDLFIGLKEVVKAGCTPSQAQIAKLLDNPVGNFVAIPFQYDYVQLKGPQTGNTKTLHKLQIFPTFPISLGGDWNLINRVVFPFYSAPINKDYSNYIDLTPGSIISNPSFPGSLADPYGRTNGFGDMVYVGVAAPKKSIKIESTGAAVIWGVGATSMFPTASADVLGTGKYSLGPAAVAAYLGREWTFGIFPQHWWSVGGDSKRANVSLTNIQYFIYYAPPWDPKAQWRIGMSPIVSINWKATGDKVTLPVGLGIGRMFEIFKLPVRIQIEADYSVLHPDDKVGSRWDFRLSVIPVIPTFLF